MNELEDFDFSDCLSIHENTLADCQRNNKNKTTSDQQNIHRQNQEQEQQRLLSNRDSGISSGQNRQISDHMNRFLTDTMKTSQNQQLEEQQIENRFNKYSLNISSTNGHDGRILIKQSEAFVSLANSWERLKNERTRQQKVQPVSSIPPLSSGIPEGARGERQQPTRFSGRLTPDIEILQDNDKRDTRRSKYDYEIAQQKRHSYETRPKSNNKNYTRRSSEIRKRHDFDVPQISRPRSRSLSKNSCDTSSRCCHHTTVYQYNYPPDFQEQRHVERQPARQINRKPSVVDEDNRILQNLALLKADVIHSKKISKVYRNKNMDDEGYVFNFSPTTKNSFKRGNGSFDSGIEEPSFKKVEVPAYVSAHSIMTLLNFNKKYDFLTNVASTLFQRKNIQNLVAEFEAALLRHASLLDRQIIRYEKELNTVYDPEYSNIERKIDESRKQRKICLQKAMEFEAIIRRDQISPQKLPSGKGGSIRKPDMDYQKRLIYEVFLN